MAEKKIPILAVVGPTASGKTALAVELALQYDGEVLSADSMQIYRGMQIATAKPDCLEMKGVRHHMMDFLPPDTAYSVADYVRDARSCIREMADKGILPIIAGGTGLYVDSLIRNIQYAQLPSDPDIRAGLERRAQEEGVPALLEELASADPETAARLHVNDRRRIIRALEVFLASGVTLTEHNRRSRLQESPYRSFVIGLQTRDRALLYDRINARVDRMMDRGLLDEARDFLEQKNSVTAVQAIGYKELAPYFSGLKTLEEAVEDVKRETRRYAKRQLSWFRRNPEIHWFYLDDYASFDALCSAVCTMIEKRCDFIGGQTQTEKE